MLTGVVFRLIFALMTNTLILSSLISLMSMSLEGVGLCSPSGGGGSC